MLPGGICACDVFCLALHQHARPSLEFFKGEYTMFSTLGSRRHFAVRLASLFTSAGAAALLTTSASPAAQGPTGV
jgi:hypothetical protein